MRRWLARTGAFFGVLAGLPLALGAALGAAERWASGTLYRAFGWAGVLLTGLCGTPLHETAHYLACRLLRLEVTEVALFRPVAGREDGVLGYVRYRAPAGMRGRLAVFFAGVAPLLLGTAAILLLVLLLTPEVWDGAAEALRTLRRRKRVRLPEVLGALLRGTARGLGTLRGFGVVRGFLCLWLAGSAAMHLALSTADLRGLPWGLGLLLIVSAVLALLTLLLRRDPARALRRAAAVEALLFGAGLGLCLLFGAAAQLVIWMK